MGKKTYAKANSVLTGSVRSDVVRSQGNSFGILNGVLGGKRSNRIFFYCCTVHFDICTVHSPTNALFYFEKHIKIYIKIHINIAPTRFGLRSSSGGLH